MKFDYCNNMQILTLQNKGKLKAEKATNAVHGTKIVKLVQQLKKVSVEEYCEAQPEILIGLNN